MRATSLLLVILCSWWMAKGQEFIAQTKTYTTKDGLSSNEVFAIHKDTSGLLWLGTRNGLDVFDGQHFEHIPILPAKNQYVAIHQILEDNEKNLWLIHYKDHYERTFHTADIWLFNYYTRTWSTPEEFYGDQLPFAIKDLKQIITLSDHSLLFITTTQLYHYSKENRFRQLNIPHKTNNLDLNEIDSKGRLWLGMLNHKKRHVIQIWDTLNRQLTDKIELPSKYYLGKNKSLGFDQQGNLLFAISSKSRNKEYAINNIYSSDGQMHKHIPFNADLERLDFTNGYYEKQNQRFWFHSEAGLFVTSKQGKLIEQFKTFRTSPGQSNIVFDQDITWVSNGKDGFHSIHLQANHFHTLAFHHKENWRNSLRGIQKDKKGNLWLSTMNGDIQVDPEQNIHFKKNFQAFSNFLEDEEGKIWSLYNEHYLKRYDPTTNESENFDLGHYPSCWVIYQDQDGQFWTFNQFNKLFIYNPITKSTKTIDLNLEDKERFSVYDVQKRDKNRVWLCTNKGLLVYNQKNETIEAIYNHHQQGAKHLPAFDFHHFYRENKLTIWLATGDAGVLKVHENSDGTLRLIKQFTMVNGLSSNAIHAIYEDDYNYLWFSSDEGLMQLDKKSERIRKFYQKDGIIGNEFNRISHHQASDGTLYFGGVKGLTWFHPKHFAQSRNQIFDARLILLHFEQYDDDSNNFKEKTADLLQTNTIIIPANNQFFRLTLALADYKNEGQSTFAFKIDGLHDWQYQQNNTLNFNALPYGKHQLQIKAINSNGQSATNELVYQLQVLRPFYLQWWFITLCFSAVLFGGFILIKTRTRRIILQQETEQLKELDKMKSRFFANISHELRTPLTLIDLPLQGLTKNAAKLPNELKHYVYSISKNKKNLKRLIDEILDLSKLEAGKLELELRPVKLRDYLERVVGLFHSGASIKNIEFRYSSFIDDDLFVQLDREKLEMVINNLLSNALKFTAEKGTIHVYADWKEHQELVFKIQDNGRGIHPEDLPFVFDRYYQARKSSRTSTTSFEGGTGIGLAICKEFIELMSGQIHVSSQLGKGSTFSFHLPLEKVSPSTLTKLSENPNLQDIETQLTSLESSQFSQTEKKNKSEVTLLVVEDHPQLQAYLCNIIGTNYQVITASNGVLALDKLKDHQIHLIISDVMMPEMDGFTFLETVKQDDAYCGIPFILLTARTALQDKLQGLRIGVDAYMTKPFATEELLLRIEFLLNNARNRQSSDDHLLVSEQGVPTETITKTQSKIATLNTPDVVSKADLDWLQKVEVIALREIKNPNYSVEDLAQELFLSRRQVYRKIKRITGLAPRKYLNSTRMQKAKILLETEDIYTLTQVAYTVGFENVSYFAKLFEAEFGIRPHDLLTKE